MVFNLHILTLSYLYVNGPLLTYSILSIIANNSDWAEILGFIHFYKNTPIWVDNDTVNNALLGFIGSTILIFSYIIPFK